MKPFVKHAILGCVFILLGIIGIGMDMADVLRHGPSLQGLTEFVVGIIVVGLGAVLIAPDTQGPIIYFIGVTVDVIRGKSPAPLPEQPSKEAIDDEVKKHDYVVGANAPPPAPDEWNTSLREVLHQASLYSTPTYYLDRNLNIIDWNLAFGVLFADIVASLRMTHVNWFISKLSEPEKVFKHARKFSEQNPLPMVDTETLNHVSKRYGPVQLVKFALQLHDEDGQERGWTVSLFIRRMGDWPQYRADIQDEFKMTKLWSYYGASYDKILLEYPPYLELQQKVARAVPRGNYLVADLGAGSGNTTRALLARGHTVWSVESNVAMLDHLRAKNFDADRVKIVNSSVENLEVLAEQSQRRPFDAIVMVNVLYALKDPAKCLRSVNRLLPIGGILAFSTTHSETRLEPLLDDIKAHLKSTNRFKDLQHHYERVHMGNMTLESMARLHSRQQYLDWVKEAGFEVTQSFPTEYPDQEKGVVMIVYARKCAEIEGSASVRAPVQEPARPPIPIMTASWQSPTPVAEDGQPRAADPNETLAPAREPLNG